MGEAVGVGVEWMEKVVIKISTIAPPINWSPSTHREHNLSSVYFS